MNKKVTRISGLYYTMIGKPGSGHLKYKAAETRHLLPFTIAILKELQAELADHVNIVALIRAGERLEEWIVLAGSGGRKMTNAQVNRLTLLSREHNKLAMAADVKLLPKHHLFQHAAEQAARKGGPKYYSTWLDESVNSELSKVARACHRETFTRKALQRYAALDQYGSGSLMASAGHTVDASYW